MSRSFFPLQDSSNRIYQPWDRLDTVWLCILGVAAFWLYTLRLDQPALLSTPEQLFQDVAESYWRSQTEQGYGLHLLISPTLYPITLLHRLAACTYAFFGGVTASATRLPGACFAASTIPLLYLLGRELFLQRPTAILAASIFLTQWAVVQQGRLASLESVDLGIMLTAIYCLLRSRRDLRWTLGLGICLGLECLTDLIWAVALSAIALSFVSWDTPRLLTAKHFWGGIGLGLLAVGLGVGIQQELNNVPFWTPWLNLPALSHVFTFKSPQAILTLNWLPSLPWILFWPTCFWLLSRHYNLSWGRLSIIWGSLSGLLLCSGHISGIQLYVVFALLCGVYLTQFWQLEDLTGIPYLITPSYPRLLRWGSGLVMLVCWGNVAYSAWHSSLLNAISSVYQWLNLGMAITATVCSVLITQGNAQWLPILIWGTYCSLALILQTPHWLSAFWNGMSGLG